MSVCLETELLRFRDRFRGEIRTAAEALLKEDMPVITEELFGLYEKTGNRLTYEKVYFTRRRFLAVLGLEAIAQKEERGHIERAVTDKLAQVMEDICREECWALPPHVKREEEAWQVTVDLFAAETAQTLAELADRLKAELPEPVRENIEKNVENRVFLPFFTSKIPYRSWERGYHNWNGVCAGAVGSACLHLMRDEKRLAESLERICDGLQYYLMGFAEDGACTEGLSYYTYGMGYFANFAQELYDHTAGRRNLFTGEWGGFERSVTDKRARIAAFERKCFFPDGRTVSFADSSSRGRFRVGLSCVLAMHYPSFVFPDFGSAAELDTNGCYHFAELRADLLMPRRLIRLTHEEISQNGIMFKYDRNPETNTSESRTGAKERVGQERIAGFDILPSAQWAVARSVGGAGMACKGGHNKEFHNHNDVGHFIYEGGGVLFLTDLGAGEYCKGYFGPDRYKVFCNRSLGHSVPIVNGKEQPEGEEYTCRSFFAEEKEGMAVVEMELAGAYEKGALESLRRRLEFRLDTGGLQVQDEIDARGNGAVSVTENLVTQIAPMVIGNEVLLPADRMICMIKISGSGPVTIQEREHNNHKGVPEKVYAIQWEAELTEGKGSSGFCVSLQSVSR